MSINWSNLEAEVETWALNEYATVIKPMFEKEAAAFKPLIAATEEDLKTYGIPIVMAFFGAASVALTGSTKMSSAVAALITDLGAVGKTVVIKEGQAALQIIVNQVKSVANVPPVAQ